MKMKEVCKRTGLTERAVRFYVSEGLVTPESQYVRGRTYIEFSETDVQTLQAVAVLRNAQFTVAEISLMQRNKAALTTIPGQAADRLRKSAADAENTAALLTAADGKSFDDIVSLAKSLTSNHEPKPNFGKLDGVSRQERDEAFEKFIAAEEKRTMKKRRLVLALAAVLLVIASVFGTLAATGQLKKEEPAAVQETEFIREYPLSQLGSFEGELRGYIPQPSEGFGFKTVGESGIDGRIVTVYTDGEDEISLWGRKLNESEALAAEEMDKKQLKLSGNEASPENRLEAVIPNAEKGEYYVLWIESDTVSETEMAAICASGVGVLTPWGEEIEILP